MSEEPRRRRGRPATGRTDWRKRTLLLTETEDRLVRILAGRSVTSVAGVMRRLIREAARREGLEP